MTYDIAKKAEKETQKLQKARRDLDALKKEEDDFIKNKVARMKRKEKNLIDEQNKNDEKIHQGETEKIKGNIKTQQGIAYDITKKTADEVQILQDTRRDFDKLKQDEDKYLAELQVKSTSLLAGINRRINSAHELFNLSIDRIVHQITDYKTRFGRFTKHLKSVVERSDEMMDSIVLIRKKTEKTEEFIKEKYSELQEFEKTLGIKDKDITKRELKVDKLMKQADYKLKEAYTLADWAKRGKRYTIKKDVK